MYKNFLKRLVDVVLSFFVRQEIKLCGTEEMEREFDCKIL